MDKIKILKLVITELEEELRRKLAAQEAAAEGATHVEAKAETKWDTCGLEQSYLARGHAQQFELLVQQLEELRAFSCPAFNDRAIAPGALVETEMGGEKMLFILLHCGGGIEVQEAGREVTVITPESPVGSALLDKIPGDTYSFRTGVEGSITHVE